MALFGQPSDNSTFTLMAGGPSVVPSYWWLFATSFVGLPFGCVDLGCSVLGTTTFLLGLGSGSVEAAGRSKGGFLSDAFNIADDGFSSAPSPSDGSPSSESKTITSDVVESDAADADALLDSPLSAPVVDSGRTLSGVKLDCRILLIFSLGTPSSLKHSSSLERLQMTSSGDEADGVGVVEPTRSSSPGSVLIAVRRPPTSLLSPMPLSMVTTELAVTLGDPPQLGALCAQKPSLFSPV